jgi:DnaJ-class molecular chaperone
MFRPFCRNISFCPYTTLGVSKNASKAQIRKAYLAKVMQTHPDRFKSDVEKERHKKEFVRMNRAYEMLYKNPGKYSRFHDSQSHDSQKSRSRSHHTHYTKNQEYWARRAHYEQTKQGENPTIYGPNTLVMGVILAISSVFGFLSYQRRKYMFKQSRM